MHAEEALVMLSDPETYGGLGLWACGHVYRAGDSQVLGALRGFNNPLVAIDVAEWVDQKLEKALIGLRDATDEGREAARAEVVEARGLAEDVLWALGIVLDSQENLLLGENVSDAMARACEVGENGLLSICEGVDEILKSF